MLCKICNTRRPRRFCPGVDGEICAVCCGTGREETVSCPLDCEYLREARTHEKPPVVAEGQIPNLDIEVRDSFLRDHEPLLVIAMKAFADAGLGTPGVVDYDLREALDALVRTYRTLETGLYYETRPSNPLAANVQTAVQEKIAEFRKAVTEKAGLTTVRDADVLGVLAFLQRIEYQLNNGKKRGRAFLDFLRGQFSGAEPAGEQAGPSPLIMS